MTEMTGCRNQEMQQQQSTEKSPTTFDGISTFQIVKPHITVLTNQLTVYETKNHQKLAQWAFTSQPLVYISITYYLTPLSVYPFKNWDH